MADKKVSVTWDTFLIRTITISCLSLFSPSSSLFTCHALLLLLHLCPFWFVNAMFRVRGFCFVFFFFFLFCEWRGEKFFFFLFRFQLSESVWTSLQNILICTHFFDVTFPYNLAEKCYLNTTWCSWLLFFCWFGAHLSFDSAM